MLNLVEDYLLIIMPLLWLPLVWLEEDETSLVNSHGVPEALEGSIEGLDVSRFWKKANE